MRIRLHSLLVKKKTPVFVNPYAPKETKEVAHRISPYSTEYGTKQKKSWKDILFPQKEVLGFAPTTIEDLFEDEPTPTLPKEPTFFADMKTVSENDLLWIASKCKSKIPKREPHAMKETDIKKACESIKW